MAKFVCETCLVTMYADSGLEPELCPRCGAEMGEFLEEEDCTIPQRRELERQERALASEFGEERAQARTS
jgi:hypothetical protein